MKSFYPETRESASGFDEQSYHSSKRSDRRQGVFFLMLGGLVILDSGSPIPIPITGLASILLGTVILVYGWYKLHSYQKLPLHEALQLGRAQGGQMGRTDIFLKLRLTPEKTDELLEQLVREGFIERVSENLPPENEATYRLLS